MKALQEFLGIEEEKIFSVVMFWGEAEFKTPMPPNLMTHGYVPYIKSKCDVLFTCEEMTTLFWPSRPACCRRRGPPGASTLQI